MRVDIDVDPTTGDGGGGGGGGFGSLDPTLEALAGQNWVANSIPVGTGADTVSQVSFAANRFPARSSSGNLVAKVISDFGLSLVDDADADAARATLHMGTNRTPSSSSDTGTAGEICWDANYIYVCIATNTWKRSPISTW